MIIFILLGVAVLCFVLVGMMSSNDKTKLDGYKTQNSELYQKYKEAFDSQPGDFTGVQLTVEFAETKLLPGETVHHSYAIPRFYGKDANLFILTDKRLMYVGIKLTKSDIRSIPYSKIESIEVKSKTMASELEVRSKEEKIEIYFVGKHLLDNFYTFLTEKQLSQTS